VKAFAYLRVSGKSQIEGDGFPRQEAAIRAYAKRQGITIAGWFKEQGVSGTKSVADRPAFVAMMEALHSDGVKLVLIENLSRLARDLMVQESIIEDLNRHGFQLVSVSEPDLCNDDPSRTLIRRILGAFHEFEKQMVTIKLRGARVRAKAKRGRCEGRKPFGTLPGEKEVLARIFELRDAGATAIAEALNTEGHKTRSGKKWLQPTISKILNRSRSNGPKQGKC